MKLSRREILVDGAVAGLGIEPNDKLAQAAGLKVEDGIVVDEFLRTSHPDIYAAGDVARFFNPALGKTHPSRTRGQRQYHGASWPD